MVSIKIAAKIALSVLQIQRPTCIYCYRNTKKAPVLMMFRAEAWGTTMVFLIA